MFGLDADENRSVWQERLIAAEERASGDAVVAVLELLPLLEELPAHERDAVLDAASGGMIAATAVDRARGVARAVADGSIVHLDDAESAAVELRRLVRALVTHDIPIAAARSRGHDAWPLR